MPDDLLLDVYTALRPGRATAESSRSGPRGSRASVRETAAFVREAAAAYAERGLLAMPSRRFASRATRDLHLEQLVSPLPELGLVAANGPNDPEPELVVEDGRRHAHGRP